MQLTLVIPGLLDLAEADPTWADLEGTALARLLASATRSTEHDGVIGVVCAAIGISKQRDWPVAPVLAVAADLDPAGAYWLLAEPVTLLVGQLDVQLAGVVGDLSEDESAALLTTLNSHFAGDGLRFIALTPARWLISATAEQRLVTHPADDALGAPIFPFLPDGPDAARWRRWQSEMQMLLFAHPVSSRREQSGGSAINGVWLSGGGVYTAAREAPRVASLYTDAPLLSDLARARGVEAASAPRSFKDWSEAQPTWPSLVLLPAIGGNERPASLAALGRDWADPLRAALGAGLEVSIVIAGRGRACSFELRRRSRLARLRGRFAPPALSTLLRLAGR